MSSTLLKLEEAVGTLHGANRAPRLIPATNTQHLRINFTNP
jgi:hypothetical protein